MDPLRAKLAALPPEIKTEVEDAVAGYMLLQFKKYVPIQRRITRESVYGQPFKTAKQRRWFFWALHSGAINVPYRRHGQAEGGIAADWMELHTSEGVTLQNQNPGAIYVYDDIKQSKFMEAMGWLKISALVTEKAKNLGGVLNRAAKKAIAKVGLS